MLDFSCFVLTRLKSSNPSYISSLEVACKLSDNEYKVIVSSLYSICFKERNFDLKKKTCILQGTNSQMQSIKLLCVWLTKSFHIGRKGIKIINDIIRNIKKISLAEGWLILVNFFMIKCELFWHKLTHQYNSGLKRRSNLNLWKVNYPELKSLLGDQIMH